MNMAAARRGIMVALLLSLLAACQVPGIRDEDPTGDLGAVPESRPGDIYAELGREYIKQGQPAVALTKLKRGLEVDPRNPHIHLVLGRLYEQLGERLIELVPSPA